MPLFASIAEGRIQEAIQRGDLDDLPLKGQPLPREDLSDVPEELRMGYKVLKNAGCLPEELQLKRELVTLRDLLAACADPEERAACRRRLSLRQMQYDLLMERKGRSLAFQEYREPLATRLLPEQSD